ncbi:acyltransferase family protein [Marinomonas sp.]|uniref:acyltransferase family protein n=1 Tax=Marinomonas sp. TaxID=1904862 RepID=UPI003BAB8B22
MNITQKPTLIDIEASKNPSVDESSLATSKKTDRVIEFDYLRGLAIVLIVLGHSVTNTNDGFPVWLENIVRGGTGIFVFISGFFFHHVFAEGFDYRRFLSKKVKNVLIPFFAVSLFAIVVKWLVFMFVGDASAGEALAQCGELLLQGFVLFPHWYIPFIMATFLCAGLHLRYLHLPLFAKLSLLVMFSVVSLVIHRPEGNANVLQSLVYFTPFYLFGMLYSQYLDWMKQHYRTFLVVAIITVLTTVYLQTSVFVHIGGFHKAAFEWGGIDLQFIQKMGWCILFIGFCTNCVGPTLGKHLVMVASISFAIFFLHPLLGMMWGNTKYILLNADYIQPNNTVLYSLLSSIVLFMFQFYGTVWLIGKLKPLFGSKSRLLIGA